MTYEVVPKNFWRFPTLSFPSFLEGIEELLPTANLMNGLSVSEDEKNVYVEAAVPGLDPEDVEVTFEKGMLTIRGEKKEEEEGKKYQRKATSSFFYRVTPGDVDVKTLPQASYKNGMMTITFVKAIVSKPMKIDIKIT